MSKNTSGNTAACDHPRPRTGVVTLLALGIGGFVTGPTGPGTWQPSWSSTPSLGAWPCLRGASAPALPVHQGAQGDVEWEFIRSKIGARRRRSYGLTLSVPGWGPSFATEPSTLLHLHNIFGWRGSAALGRSVVRFLNFGNMSLCALVLQPCRGARVRTSQRHFMSSVLLACMPPDLGMSS